MEKNLNEMTSRELRNVAKELKIPNWWNLSKSVMIEKITALQQPKNKKEKTIKKTNLKLNELTYKGETKTIRQWADEIHIPWPTLYDRVNRNGWSVEDAIELRLGKHRSK